MAAVCETAPPCALSETIAVQKVVEPVCAFPAKGATHTVTYPGFPDATTLLVAAKRSRSFLERSVRELFAGGTEVIVLSSLGDAIPLCVQLLSALEEKKAGRGIKFETTYNSYEERPRHSGGNQHTPGLRIYMKKHEEFKGSRISPGYVSFCDAPEEGGFTLCYDVAPKEKCASVNAGHSELFVGGVGLNKGFCDIMTEIGHDVPKYAEVHKALLKKALEENANKKDEEVRSVQLDGLETIHGDLKIAMCRPCMELGKYDSSGALGASFISVFKNKFPHGKENNMAMVYVVGPKGDLFKSKEDFLNAVRCTSANLMTALCDYNGLARREHGNKKDYYVRIKVCRIPLIGGGLHLHTGTTKKEVATAVVAGLERGYRHGPAPRLNFAYDDDLFKQVWVETTGLGASKEETNGTCD